MNSDLPGWKEKKKKKRQVNLSYSCSGGLRHVVLRVQDDAGVSMHIGISTDIYAGTSLLFRCPQDRIL